MEDGDRYRHIDHSKNAMHRILIVVSFRSYRSSLLNTIVSRVVVLAIEVYALALVCIFQFYPLPTLFNVRIAYDPKRCNNFWRKFHQETFLIS